MNNEEKIDYSAYALTRTCVTCEQVIETIDCSAYALTRTCVTCEQVIECNSFGLFTQEQKVVCVTEESVNRLIASANDEKEAVNE